MFKYITFSVLFVLLTIFVSFGQEQVLSPTEIISAINHDLSIPLSEVEEKPLMQTPWEDGIIPLQSIPPSTRNQYNNDPALQLFNGTDDIGNILENFNGVGAQGFAPPDVSGDVGPNHYMQMVNVRFQIWDKSGNSLLGPLNLGTIWAGFPGPWQSSLNDGDPVVLYDDLADRWVATQFSLPNGGNGPEYLLVAVSQTPDPTGAWYRYGFETAQFPDYPKFGVWPDGYYFSANRFGAGFQGTYAGVMERDKMLIGDQANMVIFSVSSSISSSLLPADCDGTTPPPADAPNYFVQARGGLDVFELHVDWLNPGSSTFSGPLSITTSPFTPVSGIPQMGTSTLLDDLSDRLMQRLQYRNFGDHESMVVCHTINTGGGRAGMRWYELRNSGGWSLYQEGTFAPADGIYRWMGSISMNADGDIALGYSASSTTMFPDIRFTGRKDSDPLGVMTIAEEVIFSSSGSQNGLTRWGDYTQMAVDPDGQTFWYSNQYQPFTGSFNWSTRIASFEFISPPPCPVGVASNPNPPAGAIDIPIDETTLSWDNGSGATEIEVIFDGLSIYSGPPVTSLPMPPLSYSKLYLWKVNSSDGTCTTYGSNWTFTTMDNPLGEPLMSLTHTPGDLNVGIYNDGSIGADQFTNTGPGVTWLGVNGLYAGGVLFGSGGTGSINGMVGSFSIIDIQNVSSNFAGGFTSDANFDQITEATIDDGLAPSPYGVEITQKSYSNTGEEFVFIRYGFKNNTASLIPNAVGGIFIDWDIDVNSFSSNSGGYTLFNNVCYEFGTVTPEYYFGMASLDGASGMRTTTGGGSGTIRTESYTFITTFDPTIDPNGDFRSWIGTSLGDIAPGDTAWTTFAIIAGSTLSELESYAIQASEKSVLLGWTTINLPVELTSFTAVDKNGKVVLNWTTATELNNQGFEIERRSSENEYITIGYVDGYGTTTEPIEYSFIDNSSQAGTFFYRLKQIDFGGEYEYSDEIEIEVTGPLTFELGQNYPNPFNPGTSINYSIPEAGFVTLDVFNLLGEKVASLVSEVQNAGKYEVNFDASKLTSGVYFYQLQTDNNISVKKMLLLK
ncbi:MAG: T9SS type A sorting domain-containing protein [Ignavibacteriaceae bacterium]|nr:T9SS type A sorting domain-containing protein [Ignavibacteriaceae bacterium]